MASIIEIENPFEPFEDVKLHKNVTGTILAWLKKEKGWTGQFDRPTIVTLDGVPILQKDYGKVRLKKKSVVGITKLVGSPVQILIAVVVAVVALAAVLLFAPAPPNQGNLPAADPTFSSRGQANQIKLGQPIPSHMGKVKNWAEYGARPYNQYIDNQQYQYHLLCAGQGSYDITDIKIEDTPIANLSEVEVEVYLPGQSVTLFPDAVITSSEVGMIELYGPNEGPYTGAAGPFVVCGVGETVDKIEWDIGFPQGLGITNSKNELKLLDCDVRISYQEIDDFGVPVGAWTDIDINYLEKSLSPQRYTESVTVPLARYHAKAVRISDKDLRSEARNLLSWEVLRAFLPNTLDYGDVTMVAVKFLATANINDNSQNKVNWFQERMLEQWDVPSQLWTARIATRNPAWAALHVFKSSNGAGMVDSHIDLDGYAALAARYDSKGTNLDWSFIKKVNVWEAARQCLSVARTIPMLSGSKVTGIEDKDETIPKAMFSPSNIVKGSFSWDLQMFKLNDYTGVEIEFVDEDSWKPDTVECLIGTDTNARLEKIKINGITNRTLAYREGLYLRARTLYQREVVKFKTGLEGHLPSINSLISIVHDVPRWGDSGAVVSVDGSDLTLSKEVTFDGVSAYKIVLRNRDGEASDIYEVVPAGGLTTNVVTIAGTYPEAIDRPSTEEPVGFQFGVEELWSKLCRVRSIKPSGRDMVAIEAVNDDPRIYTFDSDNPPAEIVSGLPVTPELPAVVGLIVLPVPGSLDMVQVSWSPSVGAFSYVIETSYNGTTFNQVGQTEDRSIIIPVTPGLLYVRVAGIGAGQGAWATWQGNVAVETVVPFPVEDLALQTAFVSSSATIKWSYSQGASSYVVTVRRQSDDSVLRTEEIFNNNRYVYTSEMAHSDYGGTNERAISFEVVARNDIGDAVVSDVLDVSSPVPAALVGLRSTLVSQTYSGGDNGTGIKTYSLAWDFSPDLDIRTYRVWASEVMGFTAGPSNLLYDGLTGNATLVINKDSNGDTPDTYWRVAALDVWDDTYNLSDEQHASDPAFDAGFDSGFSI